MDQFDHINQMITLSMITLSIQKTFRIGKIPEFAGQKLDALCIGIPTTDFIFVVVAALHQWHDEGTFAKHKTIKMLKLMKRYKLTA